MGRYRKYTGNQIAMMEALRLRKTPENPMGVDMDAISKSAYTEQLMHDRTRAKIIELRAPYARAQDISHQIYNRNDYDNYPHYGQGDYDATVFDTIFSVNQQMLSTIIESDDYSFKTYSGFPYIDDQGIHCAFSIFRYGHEPDAKYILSTIRNTHAPYEQREVTLIAPEEIMQEYYPDLHGKHNEQTLSENTLLQTLRSQINSEQVYTLLSTLFNNEGKITQNNYEKFAARIQHHNLDNRDLLVPQIPIILDNLNGLPPQVAEPLKRYIAEDPMDFFEAENYNKFLSYLVKSAQTTIPKNPALVTVFRDLYLEYLIIAFYYDSKRKGNINDYLENGIAENQIKSFRDKFIKNIESNDVNSQDFVKKANLFLKRTHFNKLIQELEDALVDADISEGLKKIATSHLARLRKINSKFSTLSLAQQQTMLHFTEGLTAFVNAPNDANYTKLYKLYPKVKLDPASLELLRDEIETDSFHKKMLKLRENITICPHPYIRKEIKKNLRFLQRNQQAFNADLEQIISLNKFVTLLNSISTQNSVDTNTIEELEKFYSEFGLAPISNEQKNHLLQRTPIALMHEQINEKNYIFDTQGHILVTTLRTDEKNPVVTYSLDVTTSHPKIATEFTELLTAALQKQTTARDAGRILNLFNAKKMAISPLQEYLQIYLTQLAQTYQIAMQESNLSDQAVQAAIMESLHEINPEIITILARGLVRASNIGHFKEMLKLDTQKLNKILSEAQDDLCQHSKSILIKHLRQQFHSQSATTNTASIPNPIHEHKEKNIQNVYFDETQPFAYEIEVKSPVPDYLCSEINVYRSQNNSFSIYDLIDHIRIQTSAFNFPEDMPDNVYQTQFQNRLTQIARTYSLRRPDRPLVYNLYGASMEQISQNLSAVHHYNRGVRAENMSKLPLCLLQAWNLSNPPLNMGYSLFDLNGTISETTLMCEMALCDQILNKNSQSLQFDAYDNFLNRSSFLDNILSKNLFAFSADGRQMRRQIEEHKISWKETQYPDDVRDPKKVTVRALQKLMAFNLHYDPVHALLVQALSLHIQDKSLLSEDEEYSEQTLHLGLGHAHIFDLPQLPPNLIEPFNMLLCATDKKTAATAANIIKDHMETYYLQHSNGAALLSTTQKAIESAQNSASVRDISSTVSLLLEKPRVMKSSISAQQLPRASSSQKHSRHASIASNATAQERSISSTVKSRHRLFREKTSEEKEDLLQTAAKNKAAAFGRGRSGSNSSG